MKLVQAGAVKLTTDGGFHANGIPEIVGEELPSTKISFLRDDPAL